MMNIPFNSPMSDVRAARYIDAFPLTPRSMVLDAGCGGGEFLIRVIETHECRGLGLDADAAVLGEAKQRALSRLAAGMVEFREADLSVDAEGTLPGPVLAGQGLFDLAVCLGATHAFSMGEPAYESALRSLGAVLAPGGELFIGEGYWKRTPDPEYLEVLGEPTGIYRTHEENISFAAGLGFPLVNEGVSSDDEWDAFETAHRKRIKDAAAGNPGDAALHAKAEFVEA